MRNERGGFALIALLSLAALISAFLIASALNLTTAGITNDREQRSMNALRQAKAALIAYAASEQWQRYKGQVTDQPGALPCPDINHDGTESDEGNSDCVGLGISNTTNLIGRIPWKALGIDDLRDASGERIWYALSFNFRKLSGTTVINSDTQACDTPACNAGESQLTVTGTAPASNVVAIVFAPGQALDLRQIGGPLQTRPADHTDPAYKDPINYLESFSLGDVTGRHYTFTTNAIPVDTFNDRVLVITQAELMSAVEPVVAARIERDIGPYIQTYFTGWGNDYPFAAPFVSGGVGPGRAQTEFKGLGGQTNGLLPITTEAGWVSWRTSSISVSQIPGGTGTPSLNSVDCSASSASQISCQIKYFDFGGCNDRPAIQLQAVLLNAANSFPAPLNYKDAVMIDKNGDPLSFDSNFGNWSPTFPQFNPTTTNGALATGNGQVVFRGRLQNACPPSNGTGGTVTIRISVPPYLPITDNADPAAGWFIANQWYKQVYYAVAPALLPGGSGDCAANPPCLTVKTLPPSYATSNDKRAILVFAGRALDGSSRPSLSLNNYFEGQNSTPADFIYEHRAGPAGLSCAQFLPGTCPVPNGPYFINDRVVVVSP